MKKLIIVLLIIAVLIALNMSPIGSYLTLSNLKENSDMIKDIVDMNYLIAVLIFIAVYIAVVGLSVPGATVMTLTAGFMFGPILGTVYSNLGATTGAILVFLAARYLIGESVQRKYKSKLLKINNEIKKHGPNYMLTLRFIPLFPFFLINLAGGLSKIKLRTFAWTTAVGIIPGSFAYAYAGSELAKVTTLASVLSPGIIAAFVLLGVISFVPVLIKRFYHV